jgi:glyoxylase-like metal-dependent hydrolase (beta-lactamase superfamily II)
MQEISPHVFIETAYPGVTLGAIAWQHGLLLVDCPFRPEDVRSWRSALLNLGGGVDRLLVNLDSHYDRTLGARLMDCTVIGHERMVESLRNRPISTKSQGIETGAEWELTEGLGGIRWASPELTFTERMQVYWSDQPLILESHPGPSPTAIWGIMPNDGIIFVGDMVTIKQPPFLAAADMDLWIESLKQLLENPYKNYLIVSGRGGLVTREDVKTQLAFLQDVQTRLAALAERKGSAEETDAIASKMLARFNVPADREAICSRRIRYGLRQYYLRKFCSTSEEITE